MSLPCSSHASARCLCFTINKSRKAKRRLPSHPYRVPAPVDLAQQPRRIPRLPPRETSLGEKRRLRDPKRKISIPYRNTEIIPLDVSHELWHQGTQKKPTSFVYSFAIPASVPFNLWSRYSRVTLMTWTMARIREPKASEPVWYLGKIAPVRRGQPQEARKPSSRGTYRSARPKAEKRGKAGMSSGFLKAQ